MRRYAMPDDTNNMRTANIVHAHKVSDVTGDMDKYDKHNHSRTRWMHSRIYKVTKRSRESWKDYPGFSDSGI